MSSQELAQRDGDVIGLTYKGENGCTYDDALVRLISRYEEDENGCWIWQGPPNGPKGYARMRADGARVLAHRFAYQRFLGPIPRGLTLDHLCRNTMCVNPFHLEPVTNAENIRRGTVGDRNRAKTHCPRGHAYDEANTHVNKKNQRMCRRCMRDRMRERRAAA